ncbi:prepilin peptidase [bacterium]|nr:prepilin peptidase [bacterium]
MNIPYLIIIIEAIIFGLVVGSFLNVCIYRLPLNKSVMGRSFCPLCKKQIPLYRNIPIISYVIQLGKSACCKKSISIQYPLIEALTAVISVVTLFHSTSLLQYVIWFTLFMCPLIIVSIVDFKLKIIPDQISIPFIVVGVGVHLYELWPNWSGALIDSVLGILVGGGTLLILGEIISRVKKVDAMGGGDVKLAAMFGAFLGWRALVFIFLASSILALIYAVACIVTKKQDDDKTIPFGPFLSMAAMIAWLYGKTLTDWYFYSIVGLPFNILFP